MSTNPKKTTRSRERREFPAKVKCEAVLAVWAERRKPTEICREMGIPWQQLQNWQNQALEAMMARLQPREDQQQRQPALGSRLKNLLEKTDRRVGEKNKLQKRLERIQNAGSKSAEPES
jgi:transposase-like protein